MIHRRIKNSNTRMGPPVDVTSGCVALMVRAAPCPAGVEYSSAWEPTPAELAILNAGGSVVLTVVNIHPMVRLTAEPQE